MLAIASMLINVLLLLLGLVILVAGAEFLVRGASKLAALVGLSPLVIGLTVVAYGTSTPELAVSVQAILEGSNDISLGNVVGSNIFNVLFILGISALITPLQVAQQLVRLDVPIMIATAGLVYGMALDGRISRLDGIILVVLGVLYTLFQIRQGGEEPDPEVQAEYAEEYGLSDRPPLWQQILLIAAGLGLLILGAKLLIDSSVAIARSLQISELIIGLTIVAAGTSLPELATSVVASLKGERDIAVGNVVGSNIFNVLIVLGIAAIIASNGVPVEAQAAQIDLPVMVGISLLCLPIFFSGFIISRWEGILLLGAYSAYFAELVLQELQNPLLTSLRWVLVLLIVPMATITTVSAAYQAWRKLPSGRAQS
ncbi:calcium/sodium antiporter [Synechococcus elongatus]|uniref:Calcium/sodium antiporter n=1 Tax=Synechococcus elongatus PCC 11802 TaxID=2283154 RepID=A0AAU6R5C7_SYNEL|nr:calcium/sodium antiporter [Synechococcus elongatus]QFZ91232.1 calcium/sodium antiporter [Synechococcus elongatus PCC 11802]